MLELETLSQLEERIEHAVGVIKRLRDEKRRLEEETTRLRTLNESLERRAKSLAEENEDLLREGREFRQKAESWGQYEREREEIRTFVDSMLAKLEELEI